tara:strand:+ start:6223 stop:7155 length:933 start_codon:yes stop_codon:yes gene_type:complete
MGKTIKIIIPVLNEYECIDELVSRLNKVIKTLENKAYQVSITFIDDGSEVNFKNILKAYKEENKYIETINLTRNFGHQAAIRAGVDSSNSDAVIMLDGDLQDPPELIIQMVDEWAKGFDVVTAVKDKRKDGYLRTGLFSKLFYIIFSRSVSFSSTRNSGDFRLISRWVADEIRGVKEHNLYLRGYIDWLGGNKSTVTYAREERFGGKAKYSYNQSYKLAMNALVSLSDFFPTLLIRVLVLSSILVAGIFLWITYNVVVNYEILVKGWSSIILTLMISLFIQLFGFTFITFYLKKILEQTSGMKNYQIKKD